MYYTQKFIMLHYGNKNKWYVTCGERQLLTKTHCYYFKAVVINQLIIANHILAGTQLQLKKI